MSPEVLAAVAGIVSALTMLGVGKWIDKLIDLYGKRKGEQSKADTTAETEIRRIYKELRGEDQKTIDRLERQVGGLRRDLDAAKREAYQRGLDAAKREADLQRQVADLTGIVEGLKLELAECLSTHERRIP